MRTPEKRRQPGAVRIDHPSVEVIEEDVLEELEPVEADAHQAVEEIVHPPGRGIRFGALAAATGGAIASLAIGVAFDSLVRDLFARAEWLGWLALGLIALFVFALLALVGREVAGLFRLKRLARLRLACDEAAAANDRDAAVAALRGVLHLYQGRPDTARARRLVAEQLSEIIDARDLLTLAERDLVAPLDARAKALASAAARRVSVVTAVSPRAFFDVAFVLFESVRLIRRIAAIYGGRPGTLGLFRLMKAVLEPPRRHRLDRGRRHDPAAVRRTRPCRAALRQARRRGRQRADDGEDRAFGDGCLPAASLPRGRAATAQGPRRESGRGRRKRC